MADVDGTVTFDDISLPSFTWPLRTRYVPLLTTESITAELNRRVRWPALGVAVRRVVTRTPGTHGPLHLQPRWERDSAPATLQLDADQAAVLAGYGPDPVLERLWSRRHTDRLLDRIAAMGWALMLGPDFSVYGDQPRFEHLFNMRRAALFAQEMSDRGLPTAPAVYWFRLEDLRRWAAWADETNPPALFLPCHTLRTDPEWHDLAAPGLAWLGAQLDRSGLDTRVVVSGVSSVPRLRQLGRWFHTRLTVASQQPLQLAKQGRAVTADGSRERHHARLEDLFAHNVTFYARELDRAISGSATEHASITPKELR